MSFFTISSIVISLVLPSLFTKTFILEDSSCILWKALLEPYSLIADINEATSTAKTIPIVSK